MNKRFTSVFFLAGAAVITWVGWGFVRTNPLALCMTLAIALAYAVGALELFRYRQATSALSEALTDLNQTPEPLDDWLASVPAALRLPVRLRIEGERAALPGPALTPYLVGLLVMLGMLGTFLGMVSTFRGAVFALEGSADLAAIRAALAEPIKGLGLSFGTSVAGVASSAMLGLLSTIGRRERLEAVRLLDARIATVLRPHSRAHQREATLMALQAQAQALPRIADRLQDMMETVTRQTASLHQGLLDQQTRFHQETREAYLDLAQRVGGALQDSLRDSGRVAGEAIRPVLANAVQEMHSSTRQMHASLVEVTEAQWRGLAEQWAVTSTQTAQSWAVAATQQQQAQAALLQTLGEREAQTQAVLQNAADQITTRTAQQVGETLSAATAVLHEAEDLVRTRMASETQWLASQGERVEALTDMLRTELGALRDQEARRGDAAVARLETLQGTVAAHLAALGAALEAPMTRMLQTASEVPQAAAEVISQLRREMSQFSERDSAELAERTALMTRLNDLVRSVEGTSLAQRAAIDALVTSAASVFEGAGQRFTQALSEQADQASEVVARMGASAVELSSLGEAFQQGVLLFGDSNAQLMRGLQQIEAAIQQSLSRSDDQLAYYVAQARELIDLSISSQQGILEDLRRLHDRSGIEAAGAEA